MTSTSKVCTDRSSVMGASFLRPPLSVLSFAEKNSAFVIAILLAVTSMVYLTYLKAQTNSLGFPLDDSWIYQTFARNLVSYGYFIYTQGTTAGAMTSPLWTVWLAAGYALGIDFRVWAYLSGIFALFVLSLMSRQLSLLLFPERRLAALATAVFVALDWHLTWAAFSGMETIPFAALTLALMYAALIQGRAWIIGLVAGALLVMRPEGILLTALVVAYRLWNCYRARDSLGKCLHELALLFLGFAIFAIPYAWLNWSLSGSVLPTSVFAKQALYGDDAGIKAYLTFLVHATNMLFFGQGATFLLLPGLFFCLKQITGSRSLNQALPLAWVALLFVAHGVRVPQVFHNGRYLMPLIPIVILSGLAGTQQFLAWLQGKALYKFAGAYVVVTAIAAIVFWYKGAEILALTSAIINDQQVATAKWLAQNTPEGSIVATHDIGAIGYFSNRQIFDTAGLISPETIPYIHNQERLLAMAKDHGARYIAFFPDWYPSLVGMPGAKEVFEANSKLLVDLKLHNMVVYDLSQD